MNSSIAHGSTQERDSVLDPTNPASNRIDGWDMQIEGANHQVQEAEAPDPMMISVPTSGGWTFEGQLEEDDFHMLWLVNRNRRGSGRLQILLSAALKNGLPVVNATPAEQALLEAHGFGSGRIQ